MNPIVPSLDLSKTLTFHTDEKSPDNVRTPPTRCTKTRDIISHLSPRSGKNAYKSKKGDSRKRSLPDLKKRRSNERRKPPLSPRSPHLHTTKTGKLFSSDKSGAIVVKVKSARNLLSPRSSETIKTSETLKKTITSTKVKSSEDTLNQILMFIKTENEKFELHLINPEEKEAFVKESEGHKGVVIEEFRDAYIDALTSTEKHNQFFNDLSRVSCDDHARNLIVKNIIDIIKSPEVREISGLNISQFLLTLNRYNFKIQASRSKETLNRGDSITTKLMTVYLTSRIEDLMERSIINTCTQLSKLPEKALYPDKSKFTKSDAKKLEKALNTLLRDTLNEVKNIDLKAQNIFRKVYIQAGHFFDKESVGRDQIIGSFFLRLLSPFLIAKESSKKESNPKLLKAYTLISKLLHKTLLDEIDDKTMKAIPQSIQPLFKGKRYKRRQDLVQQIIEYVIGIFPYDWTLRKRGTKRT